MMPDHRVDILLVEDNPNDVELALFAFEKNGISDRVTIARDGVEALEFLFGEGRYAGRNLKEGPGIILLDLKLPKLDGLEVLRKIKSDLRTKTIPVIALTTSKESSDINTSYLLGINSYIVKPVDFKEFAEAIRLIILYWLTLNQVQHHQ
jgi:two-component system response regulator